MQNPGPDVPFPPMEAELVSELPEHGGWRYEPKWDGFRGVLENDGGELALWSRNGRPLLRYFPELRPLGELLPPHSALDGEIVISRNGALDFDAMQMRLHPAESRVRKLSAEIPATFVAFDLLLWNKKKLHAKPIEERRAELERVADGVSLSPMSDDVAQGRDWLETLQAAGFDGVVAKKLGLPYLPGSRDGVVKVKPHKTADCVVAGLRWKAGGRSTIATLLLGLYADDGHLDYVGSCAVGAKRQEEIAALVLPLLDAKSDRRFSEPNRWGTGELEEAALKPKLVVEVRFDKLEKSRFRHGTKLVRFRPDKDPEQCTWREVRPPRRAGDLADEHPLAAFLHPPGCRHELRRAPFDLTCECECAASHDAEFPVRLDPAVHVHAAVAARLRPADVPDLVQHFVHDRCDLLRFREAGAGLRVDVDAQLVRLLRVAPA